MRIVHRFYDLFVGGAEVVVLNTIKALRNDEHYLLFSRSSDNWIRAELSQLPNVHLVQVGLGAEARIGAVDAELYCFHYYPPMNEIDFRDLPSRVLKRAIIINHWYTELPFIDGLKYVFLSEESRKRSGANVPARFSRVLLNPVADTFFQIERSEVPHSVGRHSRDVEFKFSRNFFVLHEAILPGRLNVFVLGAPTSLQDAVQRRQFKFENHYWMLRMATLRVPTFLQLPQIYLYQTRDDFAETCPMNILEAMAAGIPIIAENKGGIASLITDNETGLLCSTHQEYVDKCHWLLDDTAARNRMGDAAQTWAFENTSLERFGERFLATIRELLHF